MNMTQCHPCSRLR